MNYKSALLTAFILIPLLCAAWGFMAHKEINKQAVNTLPAEMQGFYKKHIDFIIEHAITPDKRRYVVEEEGQRHYIDLDKYPVIIQNWQDAVKHYTQDTLYKYGTVPWYIQKMKYSLTKAFVEKNTERILRLSADMGHYIADANVPLHTTSNYDGQFTNQMSILKDDENLQKSVRMHKFNPSNYILIYKMTL